MTKSSKTGATALVMTRDKFRKRYKNQIQFRVIAREVDIPVEPQRAVDVPLAARRHVLTFQRVQKTVEAMQARYTDRALKSSSATVQTAVKIVETPQVQYIDRIFDVR